MPGLAALGPSLALLLAVIPPTGTSPPPAPAGAAAARSARCPLPAERCRQRLAAVRERGWLGLEVDHAAARQATVAAIVPGSPAAGAGFEVGDRLVALNGVPFRDENSERLAAIMRGLEPGDHVVYAVWRNDAERRIEAVMGRIPDDVYERWTAEHFRDQHGGESARH